MFCVGFIAETSKVINVPSVGLLTYVSVASGFLLGSTGHDEVLRL